jgi:hypothetical protein
MDLRPPSPCPRARQDISAMPYRGVRYWYAPCFPLIIQFPYFIWFWSLGSSLESLHVRYGYRMSARIL